MVHTTAPEGHLIFLNGRWQQLSELEQSEGNPIIAPEPDAITPEDEISPTLHQNLRRDGHLLP